MGLGSQRKGVGSGGGGVRPEQVKAERGANNSLLSPKIYELRKCVSYADIKAFCIAFCERELGRD